MRIYVDFSPEETKAIQALAQFERRRARDQIVILVRQRLGQMGLFGEGQVYADNLRADPALLQEVRGGN